MRSTGSRLAVLAAMAFGMAAGAPISTALQTKPAIMQGQSMPRVGKKGFLSSWLPPPIHYRHRSKPWTCTAIEQRKARKHRNRQRHKARVRA